MKTIGIVGGLAWPSSITTYRTINQLVEQRAGGGHCARMIFVQTDFADIERMQAAGDWEGVGRQIARSATKLKLAGADFYIVACNTVHAAAEYFVGADPGEGNGTPIPLEGAPASAVNLSSLSIPYVAGAGTWDVQVRVQGIAGRGHLHQLLVVAQVVVSGDDVAGVLPCDTQ